MQMETLRYYCYNCEEHFQQSQQASNCQKCHSQAIELAPSQQDPAQFEVYNIENNNNNSSNSNSNVNNGMPSPNQPMPFHVFTQNFFSFGPFGNMMHQVQSQPPNFPQISINLGQMVNQVNQMLNNGGLQQYLNSLIGESNLLAATPRQISLLEKVDKVPECPICQEEDQEKGQRKGYKLQCGHAFHIECITPWFERTNTCPSCRQRI